MQDKYLLSNNAYEQTVIKKRIDNDIIRLRVGISILAKVIFQSLF